MRRMLLGLLLGAVLAGCTGGGAPAAERPSGDDAAPGLPDAANRSLPEDGGLRERLAAPQHPVGRAWTYEGEELYNDDARFTVVVAQATSAGYLFAGAAEDDLVYEALWGSPWFGERALDMDGHERMNVLEFPLGDGASWHLHEGLRVTARAAEVTTPAGAEPGLRIEGEDDRWRVSYDYAPTLGQIVRWDVGPLDAAAPRFERLRMVAVADDQPWVWYELGELIVVPATHEPQTFEVPAGHDAVIVSAGGRDGGRALVVPQQGEAWSAEFASREDWRHAVLPATPGRWEASVAGWAYVDGAPDAPVEEPVGWAYMHVAPVTWLRGAP